jgi:hypothetical protein
VKRNMFNLSISLLAVLLLSVWAFAQEDPKGKVDECTVVLNETAKADHWEVVINFTNDEPLFGLVFPLLIKSDKGRLRYDSTSFAGSRVADFAVKIPYEDTAFTNKGGGLKLNIGLIGSVGPEPTELQPGSGVIAKHYITGLDKGITTESIVVDTTFIRPANRITGTMIDAKTNIKPSFKFKGAGKK